MTCLSKNILLLPDEAFIASGRPKFNMKSVKEYELSCVDPIMTGDLLDAKGQITINENDKGALKNMVAPSEGYDVYGWWRRSRRSYNW